MAFKRVFNLEKCGMCDLFLYDHSNGSEHSKTTVVQFLVLHDHEVIGIGRLEVQRIEFQITGVVLVVQLCEPCFSIEALFFLQGDVLVHGFGGEFPSDLRSKDFGGSNASSQPCEEERSDLVNLCEMGVGRSGDDSIEERVEWLGNKVSNNGKHGNTSVGDLSLTESLDFLNGEILGESKRIEITKRGDGTGQARAELVGVGGPSVNGGVDLLGFFDFSGLGFNGSREELGRGGRAGSGEGRCGSDDKGKGDDRFHGWFIGSLKV